MIDGDDTLPQSIVHPLDRLDSIRARIQPSSIHFLGFVWNARIQTMPYQSVQISERTLRIRFELAGLDGRPDDVDAAGFAAYLERQAHEFPGVIDDHGCRPSEPVGRSLVGAIPLDEQFVVADDPPQTLH